MQGTSLRPFGVTSVIVTAMGLVCAGAGLTLWPLPELRPDDGPLAGFIVLEPLMHFVVISAIASTVGLVLNLASLARREAQTKATIAVFVINVGVAGSILCLAYRFLR
jgi:hypothetical protein